MLSIEANPQRLRSFRNFPKAVAIVSVVWCALCAHAEATIIIFLITPDHHIYIAADSRASGWKIGGSDHACKISRFDDLTFFFVNGPLVTAMDGNGRVIFDPADTARKAFGAIQAPLDQYRMVQFASTWGQMMIENYEKVPTLIVRGELSQGTFGSIYNDDFKLYFTKVLYSPIGEEASEFVLGVRPLRALNGHYNYLGDPAATDLAFEFIENKTPRAQERSKKVGRPPNTFSPEVMQMAIEAAIDWIPDKTSIGGSVDVLSVDLKGGAKWLHVKPECDSNKEPEKQPTRKKPLN